MEWGRGLESNSSAVFPQTAIKKNNPRKYLRSVGDGETVEFDVVEGEKVSMLQLSVCVHFADLMATLVSVFVSSTAC